MWKRFTTALSRSLVCKFACSLKQQNCESKSVFLTPSSSGKMSLHSRRFSLILGFYSFNGNVFVFYYYYYFLQLLKRNWFLSMADSILTFVFIFSIFTNSLFILDYVSPCHDFFIGVFFFSSFYIFFYILFFRFIWNFLSLQYRCAS